MSYDTETKALLEKAKFGIEVETFLNGPLGSYLKHRAHLEIDEAVAELKKADPYDTKKITELQNRIYRAESFDSWLAEVIQEGWAAEAALDNNKE